MHEGEEDFDPEASKKDKLEPWVFFQAKLVIKFPPGDNQEAPPPLGKLCATPLLR